MCAERQDRHVRPFDHHAALANLQHGPAVGHHMPLAFTARIAERDGARVIGGRRGDHVQQFKLVARRHHHHIGQGRKEPDVKRARVGRPIGPDQPGPVNRKANGQVLQGDVMDDLVIAALQKGGINRAEWFQARRGHSGGKGHAMLFGDAHIKHPARKAFGHDVQPRARRHGGGNPDDARVIFGLDRQGLAKDGGIAGRIGPGFGLFAGADIEFGDAMIFVGAVFSRGIAFALDRADMDQHRTRGTGAGGAQHGQQLGHVMPVDRADISKAQFLEQRPLPTGHAGDQRPGAAGVVAQGAGQGGLEPLGQFLDRAKGG